VLTLADSKTGKSLRPLGVAAIALLGSIDKTPGSEFVFPAERGIGHFQGTKNTWSKAIKRAKLPGVTPHTLRHTIGATATSTGEALALTGAILGHANPRSTAIYAHVEIDPSRKAAERVSGRVAAALSGRADSGRGTSSPPKDIEAIVRSLVEKLTQQGVNKSEMGAFVSQLVADRETVLRGST
jgi:hypothetical protein